MSCAIQSPLAKHSAVVARATIQISIGVLEKGQICGVSCQRWSRHAQMMLSRGADAAQPSCLENSRARDRVSAKPERSDECHGTQQRECEQKTCLHSAVERTCRLTLADEER